MSVIEGAYTLIEICAIMFFVSMYFKPKPLFSTKKDFILAFLFVIMLEVFTSVFNLHWLMTLIVSVLVMIGIVKKCAVGEYPKSWIGRIQAA